MYNGNDWKKEFIYALKYFALVPIVSLFYRCYLYDTVPGLNSDESWSLYLWLLWAGSWLAYVFTPFGARGALNSFLNALTGPGIYTYIVYCGYFTSLKFVLPVAALMLVVLLVVLTIKDRGGIWYKIKTVVLGSKTVIAFCLAVMVMAMGLFSYGTGGLLKPPEDRAMLEKSDTEELMKSIEENVKSENWDKLNVDDRLSVIQKVVRVESEILGLKKAPGVLAGAGSGYAAAFYDDEHRNVVIDLEYLSRTTARDALRSAIHECRHCYQYDAVSLLRSSNEELSSLMLFDEIKEFEYGIENYKKLEYSTNPIEEDARQYSEKAVYRYITGGR